MAYYSLQVKVPSGSQTPHHQGRRQVKDYCLKEGRGYVKREMDEVKVEKEECKLCEERRKEENLKRGTRMQFLVVSIPYGQFCPY